MPRFFGVALLATVTVGMLAIEARAGPAEADSSAFANQYNGNEIFDGTGLINQWSLGGSGGIADDLSIVNTDNLLYSYTTNNGWLEHDGGSTPWEAGTGDWTVEVRAKITSTDPNPFGRFVIWADLLDRNNILVAGETGVNQYGFGFDATGDNTSDFHNYRIAYVHDDAAYYIYRDNVQVSQSDGVASGLGDGSYGVRASSGGNTRLIIGDCCSNVGGVGAEVEYEYVRYDMGGAFAPVGTIPEPASLVLVGMGLIGFAGLRRRR